MVWAADLMQVMVAPRDHHPSAALQLAIQRRE
jgi:hypothetical protein